MGRLRRKRMHKNDKHLKKKYRTKRRTKDLDQIHVDMQPQNTAKLKSQEVDMDLPGAGQYYCIQCARYFVDDKSLKDHIRSRVHRKKVKMLKEVPYTPEEAERAAGMGSYTLTSTKPLLPVDQDEEMKSGENIENLDT
ncbi:zinc finger protein 593-like [Porites lutea]|uniref:zinc finger protein 593-like n=1 Tax=Porites lutea TaxID=51062 RepID=UPI003CC6CF56